MSERKVVNDLPEPLAEIVADFALLDAREKLEYLLHFANSLQALPDRLQERRDEMAEVPECMTPVHLLGEELDGRLYFYLDVPDESPTVRGFAAILSQGLNGLTPAELLQVPSDFYLEMGLQQALTGQRMNGMSAILAHMKQIASQHLAAGNGRAS